MNSLLLLLCATCVLGWTYVPMTSENLISSSESVAVGYIISSSQPVDSSRGVWTYYQVNVTSWLKGKPQGDQASIITIALPGGFDRNSGLSLHISGTPDFTIGDRGLFFVRRAHLDNGTTIYRLHEFAQGYFNLLLSNGTSIAVRAYEILESTDASSTSVRRADDFIGWISSRAAGSDEPEPASLAVSVSLSSLVNDLYAHKRFNTMTDGSNPVRWTSFDSGLSVNWMRSPGLQPNIAGGGLIELQQAFNSWNGNPNTPVSYVLSGATTSTKGLSSPDGINSVLFNDPADYIGGSFNCQGGGGTLASGGYWYQGYMNTFRGITFRTITEGDLVLQNGIDCYINSQSNPSASLSNIITHEIGHTLGLAHSCGDSSTGSCATNSPQDLAIMRAYTHPNGGFALGSDDNSGIEYLYSTCYPNCRSASTSTSTSAAISPATPVSPPASMTTPSDSGCTLGDQACVSQSQYRTCTNTRTGTAWASPQNCPAGLTCATVKNHIYCLR